MIQRQEKNRQGRPIVTNLNADLPLSVRGRALLRASLAPILACTLVFPAAAQDAGPPAEQPVQAPVAPDTSLEANADQDASPASSDIIVTGSRIQSSGFAAPTPTTVIGAEQI